MSLNPHWTRIGLLMSAAALYLGLAAARTEVVFADGLRYIAQARALEQGAWRQVLTRAEDHPAYPLAIAAAHTLRGGDRPVDWQAAAQTASVVAAVLLVVPLYLIALELHGTTAAWLACVLTYLVPLTGQVLPDALSEGTFLLFWTSGCYFSLRFLRAGSTGWLLAAILFAGLAYLARPEGLLLPVALACLLPLMALSPSLRIGGAAGRRAWAILIFGPLILMGPLIIAKGGPGTKPAVARLLGLSPPSAVMAVERERPLDPHQTRLQKVALAVRGAVRAVLAAVPFPLIPFAIASIVASLRDRRIRRGLLLIFLVLAGWLLALIRLHYTSGYCTPRHVLIIALPMFAFAAHGLILASEYLAVRLTPVLSLAHPKAVRAAAIGVCLGLCLCFWGRSLGAPINHGFRGYRHAGDWIAAHTADDARILDLKGWGLFYGGRTGYSFANLAAAPRDPQLRWVVAHDSLLVGPWAYCELVRKVVGDRQPVRSFPQQRQRGVAQVHVFDLRQPVAQDDRASEKPVLR